MIAETQLPIIIVSVIIVAVVLTLVLFSYRLLGCLSGCLVLTGNIFITRHFIHIGFLGYFFVWYIHTYVYSSHGQ